MTDLERFIELYKSFGIDCKVNQINEEQVIFLGDYDSYDTYPEYEKTRHVSLGGYGNFYSEVIFDKDGKYSRQNFYE